MEGRVKRIGGAVEVTPLLVKDSRALPLNKEKGSSKQGGGQSVRSSSMNNISSQSAVTRNAKKRKQATTTTCFQNIDNNKMFSLSCEDDKENTPMRGSSWLRSGQLTPSVSTSTPQGKVQSRRVRRMSGDTTTPRSKRHQQARRNRAGDKEVRDGQIAVRGRVDKRLQDQSMEGRWARDYFQEQSTQQYNNALTETVGYLGDRKRSVKAARNMRKLDLNIASKDRRKSAKESQKSKVEKSVELSLGNYSQSVHEDLPSKIFSQSVLEKLSLNSMNQEEKVENVSTKYKLSAMEASNLSGNDSVMRCEELVSNQGSIHQLSSLSGPNKASNQGANQRSFLAPANTDLLSLSYISAITDLTTDPHEQASSLDLAASNVQLHSTFSYPLHSTFRVTEPSFILPNNSACVKSDDSFKSSISSSNQKDSIASSIGLNEAEMLMSLKSSTGSASSSQDKSAGLSVTAVIRNTVKEVVPMDSSNMPSHQSNLPDDFNNNNSLKSNTYSSSKLTLSMLSTRKPGDGSEMSDFNNGVLDSSYSSCDSSTLSICVDDESFEGDAGDATYTGPTPDGNCDVCKIMKRQKASLNLKCSSDHESDRDNSQDGSHGVALVQKHQSSPPSKLHTPHRQALEQCIQQARATLQTFSPEQYSPTRWVDQEDVPKRSLRRTSRSSRDSERDSYKADGSSVCYKSAASLSLESQDSGRGSSYFSDTVSLNSSCHGSKVWHSTPFTNAGNNQSHCKPVLKYNMGTTELKQNQGGIPFSLHVDPENFNTPKPCKKIKTSLERGLRDSTGKYLNTPVSKSVRKSGLHSKGSGSGSSGEDVENCDYNKRAIKKKLRTFCKNFQQENVFANLQSLGSV